MQLTYFVYDEGTSVRNDDDDANDDNDSAWDSDGDNDNDGDGEGDDGDDDAGRSQFLLSMRTYVSICNVAHVPGIC